MYGLCFSPTPRPAQTPEPGAPAALWPRLRPLVCPFKCPEPPDTAPPSRLPLCRDGPEDSEAEGRTPMARSPGRWKRAFPALTHPSLPAQMGSPSSAATPPAPRGLAARSGTRAELSGVVRAAGTMAQAVRSPLCPDDFCPATLPAELPSSLALDALRKPGTELWLIRTPVDFSPASLNGCKVPLVGFQTLKSHRNEAGVHQRYHILSNSSRNGPETLLAPSSSADGQLVPAPALQGTLSIIEVPRSKSSSQSLHAIPTSPPPQIPAGLRPRFQAFGGQQPVLGPPAQTAAGEAGEVKSSRKRRKPELVSQKPSPQEILNGVGELNSAPGQEMPQPIQRVPVRREEEATAPLPAKKKKKKKKKELEGEMMEPAGEMPEPEAGAMELQQEAVLSPTKAKKSKKRRELEGEMMEPAGEMPQPEAGAMELQQEAVLSPTKAKKSKKRRELEGEMMEPAGEMPQPEAGAMELQQEAVLSPTKAKKSKKRRELEGEMMEPAGEVPEARAMELQQEAVLSSTKAKKSKKRRELEGEMMEPAGEVPKPEDRVMELQQEAVLSPRKAKKSKKRRELEGEMMEPEERPSESEVQIDLQEEKAPSSARKKSRKKQEAGGEMLEEAEMTKALGEAQPPHSKKKKRKPEEGEGAAPEPPKEMEESLAGVPESVPPSPGQGVEEKRKKKRRHQGEGGPAEA